MALPKITDKINLPTSVTAMETISRLLRVVVENEPLTSAASKPLFMAAKALGIRKKAAKADTHTEGTFRTFGLIKYLDQAKTTFETTQLGKDIAVAYDEDGPIVDENELVSLALRLVCSWFADNDGRDIHPGRIFLDLLCDEDLDGYVTEHEYTAFLINNSFKSDSQFDAIKEFVLDFRAKGENAICDYTETCKTYLFLPAFVNKWKLLRKGRVFDFESKNGTFRWTIGSIKEDAEDATETEDSDVDDEATETLFGKWNHVTEFRLTKQARQLYLKLKMKEDAMFNGKLGSIQKIIYGAPGTGKSFGTDDELVDANGNEKAVSFRTTFHPDSDYSTFVGAYKPTMKKIPRIVQDGTALKKPNYAADVDDALKVEERISYEFRPQAFMSAYVAAWKEMAKGAAGKPVVLVIEEINRGNCAQIFGDLFQLLDRGDDGYSTYPIDADTDLAKWLKNDEKDENNQLLRFGSAGLGLTKPTDQTFKMKQSDWDAVMIGKKLALPPNLYIWATMNTSDQSLFPIDSAFKRRWDWKYVPIREGKYKEGLKKGQKLGWKIKFNVPAHQEGAQQIPAKDYSYDWWEFLKNINAKIFKTTESEDKKLGYFFVKPDGEDTQTHDGTISADRFVSKVIFYLWNDVFKDYGIETIFKADDAKKSDDEAKGVEFQAFFDEEDDKADVNTLLKFFKHIELKSDEEIAAAQVAQQQPTASAANQQGQNTNP